jgi:tellurite resistance protein
VELDTPTLRRLRDRLLASSRRAGESIPILRVDSASLDPEQSAAQERVAPIAEVLFLMMVADGESAAEEEGAVRKAIDVLTGDILPQRAVGELLARFAQDLREQGRRARLEQIASKFALERPEVEAAFAMAAAVALSDGRIDGEERGLVEELRGYLGISERRARDLLGTDPDQDPAAT